jgi:hypothetical protein
VIGPFLDNGIKFQPYEFFSHHANPQKISSIGSNCFKGRNTCNHYQVVPRAISRIFQGTAYINTFRNLISFLILGYGVYMSTSLKSNTFSSVQNTPCPVWYSGVFIIVGTISLSGPLFWMSNLNRM